ncbi:transposase [Deinococcus sp. A31D244]|uniref:transposase n=1 Tax=Deinococcus sp. A31D244 TaxID=3397675 RepID=UPI0039E0EDAC
MYVSWAWLYRNKEPEQRFVMSNINLGGKYLARVGKRRWRIEGFFKTIKGQFGLERFAQHSKKGVTRWWCLSGLAYLLCHLTDQDVPPRPPETWPDWGRWREPFGSRSPRKCVSGRFNWKSMRFSLSRTHFLPPSPKLQDVSSLTAGFWRLMGKYVPPFWLLAILSASRVWPLRWGGECEGPSRGKRPAVPG